jgi:hypothetical protein
MRCHEAVIVRTAALLYITLEFELTYERVLAHTVREASHTCALVGMERHAWLNTRLSACGAVLTRAAYTLVHIEIAVATSLDVALLVVEPAEIIATRSTSKSSYASAPVSIPWNALVD